MKKIGTVILMLAGPAAWGGEVLPGDLTVFQSGTPAVAAEVNANFQALADEINDNNARIAASADAVNIIIDCDAEGTDALNNAIQSSNPVQPLNLTTTGTCGPVSISRDNVSIDGQSTTTIGSLAGGDNPVSIESARNIVLSNVTLDAQGTAENALSSSISSVVTLSSVVAQNSTDNAINNILESTMVLDGINDFGSGSPVGFNTGGSATTIQFSGSSSFTGSDSAIQVNVNSLMAGGGWTIGNLTEVEESHLLVFGDAQFSTLNVSRQSSAFIEADGATISIGVLNVGLSSTADLEAENGGSIAITGNTFVGFNSSFRAESNNVGSPINISQAAQLFAFNASIFYTGEGVNHGAGFTLLETGSRLFFDGGANADAASSFLVRIHSHLRSDGMGTPPDGAIVTCYTPGFPIAENTGAGTDLCL